jgi:hypothetical protein
MEHRSSRWVKFYIANAEHIWNSSVPLTATAPQYRSYACNQFTRIKRLGQIIVGADFQSHNAVYILASGRKQDHWNARGVANFAQDIESVHARQHYVEHNHQVFAAEGA